jgi:DNA-binding transcriptional LysR family regulator
MNLQTTDWNKFRTFYHVAKAKSFTKAAENLHISQPALSRRISSLESSLNMRLFERVTRGVVPTEEGKALLETVDAMLNVFLRYGEKVNNKHEKPQGLLKISVPNHFPSLKISQWLPEFLKMYPQMKFAFVEGSKDIGFSSYQADAAIREFDDEAQNLEQIYLTTSLIGLYASAEYLKNNGAPEKIEDLNAHRLIALGDPYNLPVCAVNQALEVGVKQGKQWTPHLCVNSITEIHRAVKAGLGIAALPDEYASEDSSLVKLLPEIAPVSVDLYYVFPVYHNQTKRVTAYGEFLAEKFKRVKPTQKVVKLRDTGSFKLDSRLHVSYA